MKKFVDRVDKFLSLDDSYFTITYDKISNVDNCRMIRIEHKINLLNNYRWVLIDRVFTDNRLNIDKWSVSLQKFSLFILNEILNNRSINDISVKLDNAVNMKCRDILISGYKDRDYEYIKNYRTAEDKSLLIYKEVE